MTSRQGTNKNTTYYFINKNGDKVDQLREWDQAEPFGSPYIGFAKVKLDKEEYLLDTLGGTYQYFKEYDYYYGRKDTIKVLDLSEKNHSYLDKFFNDNPWYIKNEIIVLDLHDTELDKYEIRLEKKEFPNLKYLDLSNCSLTNSNQLRRIIENIPTIKYLILKNNSITELPKIITQLKNLTYLDLSNKNNKKIKNLIPIMEGLIDNGIRNLTLIINERQLKELSSIEGKTTEAGWNFEKIVQ